MTTVGVDAQKLNRVDALRFPSYNYHYHAFKNKQLCDLIHERTRGPTPSFRRVTQERNRQAKICHKLEIAAVPGTTGRDIYQYNCFYATPAPCQPDFIARARVRPQDFQRWLHHSTPVTTSLARERWCEFLNKCPERFQIKLPLEGQGQTCTPYFDGGYALRYLRPDRTTGVGLIRSQERFRPIKRGNAATDSPFRPVVVSNALTSGQLKCLARHM